MKISSLSISYKLNISCYILTMSYGYSRKNNIDLSQSNNKFLLSLNIILPHSIRKKKVRNLITIDENIFQVNLFFSAIHQFLCLDPPLNVVPYFQIHAWQYELIVKLIVIIKIVELMLNHMFRSVLMIVCTLTLRFCVIMAALLDQFRNVI